ncbi:MAG: response regulator transcription factor, partial [Rhodospirillales bacterium]
MTGPADENTMSTGKQILIVDDDTTLLEMLSEQLQLHEEFSTIGARSATEALDLAKEDYFDVIILDVGLPDMDGREVCRLMRRNGVT